MNKGIKVATGEWINFMNCGDYFVANNTLESVFGSGKIYKKAEILYGDSIQLNVEKKINEVAMLDIGKLQYFPIYRHGASFVKTEVHKKYLFDLSKQKSMVLLWIIIVYIECIRTGIILKNRCVCFILFERRDFQ